MKKTFSFLLCFCIALSMLPLYAGAETAIDNNITWVIDDDGTLTISETGIESLKIPEGVKNIGTGIVNDTPLYNSESNWENGTLYIDNRLIDTKDALTGEMTVKPGTVGIAGGSIKGDITSLFIPKSVIGINIYAFAYSVPENICFEGSEEEWNKIFSYPDDWDAYTKKPTFRFNAEISDERNLSRYEKFKEAYGTYGVFELPEGAVCRHHDEAWIKQLLSDFSELEYSHLTFTTMNGNKSNGFYFIGELHNV